MSGLGIAYARSPIIEGAGERLFDDTMRGGSGIGSRFLLVGGGREEGAHTEAAQQFVQALGEVVELRRTNHEGTMLVRPDGYVAYSNPHAMGMVELNAVRALLARQSH